MHRIFQSIDNKSMYVYAHPYMHIWMYNYMYVYIYESSCIYNDGVRVGREKHGAGEVIR